MAKLLTLEEMLGLSPYEFSNQFFVRKVSHKSAWNRGLKMPDSVRQKISEAQKGKNHTSFEARSKAQKGKPKSDALRMAISKARKGKIGLLGDNPRARGVICPAGYFETIKEAALAMSCDGGTMRRRIQKGFKGYYWAPKKISN